MVTNDEILEQAVKIWGKKSQIDMAIEECGELLTALHKLRRRNTIQQIEAIEDEVADVEIMMAQLRKIFDSERIEKRKTYKMLRLYARINEHKQKIENL